MGAFQTLFNLSVMHDFYAAGVCPCLDFIPTEKTRKAMVNAGLVFKKTHAGIALAYDQDRLEALQLYASDAEDPLCFEFKGYAKDPEFRSYTVPFSDDGATVLYFDNEGAVSTGDDKIKLHESEYVSKINLVKLDSVQAKDILSHKDRLVPPVIAVRICAGGKRHLLFDDNQLPLTRDYYLNFSARQTFWKYYLLGGMNKGSAFIFDPDNKVEFESTGEAELSDKKVALTFRSKQRIPLSEKSEYRFQLREKGHEGEKVLIKRLPVAHASQTGKDVVAEQGMVVSEIYINY